MDDVFVRKKRDTQRRRPCEDVGQYWSYIAITQGPPKIVVIHKQLEEGRKDSALGASEGAETCWHLEFGLVVHHNYENRSCALGYSVCGKPRKLVLKESSTFFLGYSSLLNSVDILDTQVIFFPAPTILRLFSMFLVYTQTFSPQGKALARSPCSVSYLLPWSFSSAHPTHRLALVAQDFTVCVMIHWTIAVGIWLVPGCLPLK